ncbi:MAG: YkgJ family cysteine cluster protein [Desulfobacterota bacterium]|nr:YkgJ family cysteine cluster protein [Thermodesulfobacteriota bacterium]
MPLSSFNRKLIEALSELYAEMDRQTAEFRRATGLRCPPGCGQCCETQTPQVTVLEMLPAAGELFARGTADRWLERIASSGEGARCVFYEPDPSIRGNGLCQFYGFRPSVCRLFGFAGMKDREGRLILQACRRQKEEMPLLVEKAQEALSKGGVAPSYDHFFLRLFALEPSLRGDRMPINRALRLALERYGLMVQLVEAEGFESEKKGERP